MIVEMKKITLVAFAKKEKKVVEDLREAGVVHIHLEKRPEAEKLDVLKKEIDTTEKVISVLKSMKTKKKKLPCDSPIQLVKNVSALMERKSHYEEKLLNLKKEISRIDFLGDFDPNDVKILEEKGIKFKLYRCPKKEFQKLDKKFLYEIVYEKRGLIVIAVFGKEDISLPFEEIKLPEKSLNELKSEYKTNFEKLYRIEKEIEMRADYIDCIKDYLEEMKERFEFYSTYYGMNRDEKLVYIQGYVPVLEIDRLKQFAREKKWAPLIKTPRWVNIIKPVFDFMGTVPGYREFDVSMWFLIFLTIFFALLVGDAGYGFLFLGISLFLKWKLKDKINMLKDEIRVVINYTFVLFTVFSISAIVWGAVCGVWFGSETISKLPVIRKLIIGKLYGFSDNQDFMIYISFVIGLVHLILAHLINFTKGFTLTRVFEQIGWIFCVLSLFFVAKLLVLGDKLPSFFYLILALGISMVILSLFLNTYTKHKKKFFGPFMMDFMSFPLSFIGTLSDVISYIRLYAVGYATLAIAMNFNTMASSMGFSNPIRIIGSVLILLFGHALNIIMALMAILVHGVRLNMLEFSGHLGNTWSGIKYSPFKKRVLEKIVE